MTDLEGNGTTPAHICVGKVDFRCKDAHVVRRAGRRQRHGTGAVRRREGLQFGDQETLRGTLLDRKIAVGRGMRHESIAKLGLVMGFLLRLLTRTAPFRWGNPECSSLAGCCNPVWDIRHPPPCHPHISAMPNCYRRYTPLPPFSSPLPPGRSVGNRARSAAEPPARLRQRCRQQRRRKRMGAATPVAAAGEHQPAQAPPPPPPPYSQLSLPVYSLATAGPSGASPTMNLVTYASPISLQPRRYALGLYRGTLSWQNMLATRTGVLQVGLAVLAQWGWVELCG